ncbi:DUF4395 domain-containing protein [Paenibacillus sp. JSM ZJ436]|uniref:DUF4395 domain-containing protein n=1 Tax=Paenibacillus sp. JSM ZJ436 TaxID=3376190 RepID=UPI0037A5D5A6
MKEIPVPYVRSNQAGIVLMVSIFLVTQSATVIAALLAIQAAGLIFGVRGNLFIRLTRTFLSGRVRRSGTEAAELQRFNNTIAVSLLGLSLLSLLLGWTWAGNVLAGMTGAAALAALLGYCIGCTVYFQYKQFRARRLQRG